MKLNDNSIKTMEILYNGTNNFIVGTPGVRKTIAIDALKYLDAGNKTVIVTDPYLFTKSDTDYESDLTDILKSLAASKILFCTNNNKNDQSFFQRVQSALIGHQCKLILNQALTDCHDRFWYCTESDKAVVFGTSLNGLCKRICRVDALSDAETNELKKELQTRGII